MYVLKLKRIKLHIYVENRKGWFYGAFFIPFVSLEQILGCCCCCCCVYIYILSVASLNVNGLSFSIRLILFLLSHIAHIKQLKKKKPS
jgi:hypothetical protein